MPAGSAPRPPAFATAIASSASIAPAIGACKIGCSILNRSSSRRSGHIGIIPLENVNLSFQAGLKNSQWIDRAIARHGEGRSECATKIGGKQTRNRLTFPHVRPTHNRYPYSPIPARPVYDWPGGKRLAIYVCLNLEWFSFGEGLGAELAPGGPQPDVLNYAWRDYGNRVGVFRLAELFAEFELPVSLLINSEMYRHAPETIAAFPDAEIVGHGRNKLGAPGRTHRIQGTIADRGNHRGDREAFGQTPARVARALDFAITSHTGSTAGVRIRYLLDWCHDDQPVWMKTRHGRILSVPYPQELNDIPQIIARKREGPEFADMIVDAFDVMHEECVKRPLVMGIALHAYIVGWPHRFKHLARALRHIKQHASERVWFTTAGNIADYAGQLPSGTVP